MRKIRLVNTRKYAIVDDIDYDDLSKHRWYLLSVNGKEYAIRYQYAGRNKDSTLQMGRHVLNCPAGRSIRHLSDNGLDCRRQNLQLIELPQSGHKHITYYKYPSDVGHWRVTFGQKRKTHYIGMYVSIPEAVAARDRIQHLLDAGTSWEAIHAMLRIERNLAKVKPTRTRNNKRRK